MNSREVEHYRRPAGQVARRQNSPVPLKLDIRPTPHHPAREQERPVWFYLWPVGMLMLVGLGSIMFWLGYR